MIDEFPADWKRAERAIMEWLKDGGAYIIPLSWADNEGAPMTESRAHNLIMPDIMAIAKGKHFFVEVKFKTLSPLYGITGTLRQGTERRKLAAYQMFERCWKMPGAMAILEAKTREVLFEDIATIAEHATLTDYPPSGFKERMAFWDRDLMSVRTELDENDVPIGSPPKVSYPWSFDKEGKRKMPQKRAPQQLRLWCF